MVLDLNTPCLNALPGFWQGRQNANCLTDHRQHSPKGSQMAINSLDNMSLWTHTYTHTLAYKCAVMQINAYLCKHREIYSHPCSFECKKEHDNGQALACVVVAVHPSFPSELWMGAHRIPLCISQSGLFVRSVPTLFSPLYNPAIRRGKTSRSSHCVYVHAVSPRAHKTAVSLCVLAPQQACQANRPTSVSSDVF